MSEAQASNILAVISGALFVLFNGPLGEASLRWSRYTTKGLENASAWPHRVAFILFGLFLIAVGIINLRAL